MTLDTNTLGLSAALEALDGIDADVAVTTVTAREVEGTKWAARVRDLKIIRETGIWGESRWDEAVWGDKADGDRYEALLDLLSSGGFAKSGHRDVLTDGHKRLQRDAMILSAHARERRDIFVSNDTKAIGRPGSDLRRTLEQRFGTRAMTLPEFKEYCASQRA